RARPRRHTRTHPPAAGPRDRPPAPPCRGACPFPARPPRRAVPRGTGPSRPRTPMPRGRYSLHDPHDHTPLADEHFQCAPGPSGWRYVSRLTAPSSGDDLGSVDLALDELGRPIRLEL